MRVRVYITIDGTKETILEGDADIFGPVDYRKARDTSLRDIGFWLDDWRYGGHNGPNQKRVFVPWGSALYIVEMEKKREVGHD